MRLLSSAIEWDCLRSIIIVSILVGGISIGSAKSDICTARDGLYSIDPSILWAQVEGLLELMPVRNENANIMGIFVPGENYLISGGLLGTAYSSISGKTYDIVIILTGTQSAQPGVFISSSTGFITPLGVLYSDKRLVDEIVKSCPSIRPVKRLSSDDFWYQLPFLQYVLGSSKIINIQIGESSFSNLKSLADKFGRIFSGKRVLIVGVGELAENENSLIVNKLDKVGIGELEAMDAKSLFLSCENGDARFTSKEVAAFTVLLVAKLEAKRGKVLKHIIATGFSQEIYKGMTAIVWSGKKRIERKMIELTPAEGMKLWDLSAAIISSGKVVRDIPRNLYSYKAGVFISLISGNKLVAQTGDFFTNMNIVEAVAKFSKILVSPSRIPRIEQSMLKNAVLTVSIANSVEGISMPKIDMGIYIRRGEKVVVSMPGEFADYSPKERLEKTCLKAGLPSKSWCNPECDVQFFTVQSFSGNLKEFDEQSIKK
ncbi:AmmeMemoRadiSam system protein B [bacterium]|nr:AmmeMemoRadiSam system protein B [bacterium]